MLVATVITVVVLGGYGVHAAWNSRTGGDAGSGAPRGYEASVERSIFLAGTVIGQGVDARLVSDLPPFLDSANRAIFLVGTERRALEKLAATAPRSEAEVIASTLASLDALTEALIWWRDSVYNLRLAAVGDARAAVDAATSRLRADLERWRSLTAS